MLNWMASPEGVEPFRVFLATGFEPLHLSSFLSAHLRQRLAGRPVLVEAGMFGDLFGNVDRLAASHCFAGAVALEWEDLDLRLGLRRLGGWGPAGLVEAVASVKQRVNDLLPLLEKTAAVKPLAMCLPTLPLPPVSYQAGAQAGEMVLRVQETLAVFATQAARISNLKVVNPQTIGAGSPMAERRDVKSELSTGFPYRLGHASVMAEHLAALIQPSPPKKGLITDLDDTLWRGILGDDGSNGISWNLDHHSHIHALYQQLLRALAESGVLIGVASKNDPALAQQALARKDLMIPLDRLYPLEIGWGRKSEAVSRILSAWNIGPESVVFVDDSPLELAEVTSVHPQMECRLFPAGDDQAAYGLLEKLRDLFGKEFLAEEDALRLESLRRRSGQKQVSNLSAENPDAFLAQLGAELGFSLRHDVTDGRILELINKTNQFNLNGRRYSSGELHAKMQGPDRFVLVVSYQDKFGPLGKIAVLLGAKQSESVRLDTWVMSCRAFSRRIEEATLNFLFRRLQAEHIELDFQPTERNGPLREFLAQFTGPQSTGSVRLNLETFQRTARSSFARVSEI